MWGSWDDPSARATRGLRRPSLDARSWDHPSHPLVKAVGSHSLRPCLGEGASRRARVGRVRSLAFLSILREGSFVVLRVQIIEVLTCSNSVPAAC